MIDSNAGKGNYRKISIANACSHGGVHSVNPNLVKIDFSSNVNPLGISKKVIHLLQKNAGFISSTYPDPECKDLRKKLCEYLGKDLDPDWISVGNGATEIIHNFARTFVRNKVVIPAPTFCEYELASKRMGAKILFTPLKDLTLNSKDIIEKAKNCDAVFLCNPNNPTGLLSTKSIKKIIEHIDSSTKILIDECFIELVDDDNAQYAIIDKIKEFDNLVILRSLTKSFGLAGLRVGYSICNPRLARQLSANKIPWNVNGMAQIAGIVALQDLMHLRKAREIIKKERRCMHDDIKRKMNSFIPCQSDVNYFLIHLKENSVRVRDSILIKSGILVRDCSTFTGMEKAEYIRVAVKTHKENLLLIDALESIDR
jgi:threonine-phosphate decarboxylase